MAVTLPSVTSTTGTLNAPGVGSGLDVKGLVSQLMTVEQKPLTLLNTQEAALQAQLSSLGTVNGALSALQGAAKALASASKVQNSATSSESLVLSATAASDAVPGNYNVNVTQLAQAQKLIANGQTSSTNTIGSGVSTTLTFNFGTITSALGPVNGTYSDGFFAANPDKAPSSVVINSSNNTLAGIRDAINAGNVGVTASIINDGSGAPYRLTITSNDTGMASSLQIATSGDSAIGSLLGYDPGTATQNLKQTQIGQNAAVIIDGVNITSATNTVDGAIPGVTLSLTKTTVANAPVTVTVQGDTSSLTSALGVLVKAYNTANTTIAGVTAKGAVLQGDWAVLALQHQVVSILGSTQQAGGAYGTLSSLGISFNKDGSLTLDSAKANRALAADPVHVAALTSAIGLAIDSAATNLLGPSGPTSSEQDGINRSIKDIGSRRVAIQHRLDLTQQRYQKQFSALDTLLGSMNQTSAYLTQQLSNLPNLFNNK
jgi:flagellar hook-associated protein 2